MEIKVSFAQNELDESFKAALADFGMDEHAWRAEASAICASWIDAQAITAIHLQGREEV